MKAGGIVRVNPMAASGALNAIGAKLDMALSSPGSSLTLRWYPETNYMDMRGQPAAHIPAPPPFPLPRAGQSYQQVVQRMGIPSQFAFDAALLCVEYTENGAAWEEIRPRTRRPPRKIRPDSAQRDRHPLPTGHRAPRPGNRLSSPPHQ